MKLKSSILIALCFVLTATLVWVPSLIAQDTEPVTFTLVNGTDSAIVEFYATAPSSRDWEEDILGVDVLGPGETVEITLDDSREDCQYDFLAVFSDETELIHENVAVCDAEEYVYSDD